MSETIDLTNLIRGEGEFKNIQEVVRRTLKTCFDQMEKQGAQISHLIGHVATLKSQLANKVSRDEIDDIFQARTAIASRSKNLEGNSLEGSTKQFVSQRDYAKMKDEFYHMRNDLERKASIRYVDESLRRKLDKSDMLVKNLATFSASQYSSQLTQIYDELSHTKSAVDELAKTTSDIQRDVYGSNSGGGGGGAGSVFAGITGTGGDIYNTKHQIDAIYASMADYYTKNHVKVLLDQKQDVAGLDALLLGKADASALEASTQRVEKVLEHHERTLTALRLQMNDHTLFQSRDLLARNNAHPLSDISNCLQEERKMKKQKHRSTSQKRAGTTSTAGRASSGGGSTGISTPMKNTSRYSSDAASSCSSGYESTGTCTGRSGGEKGHKAGSKQRQRVNSSRGVGGDYMESVLRDGRVQALVEGLWSKVHTVETESERVKGELEGFRSTMSRIESTMTEVAGAAHVDTLAVVVEEQRQRLDSLIRGSTAIEPITNEFERQQTEITEIREFLQLPQHKPLQAQLNQAAELIEVLSGRVAEVGTAAGRAGIRIEAVEAVTRQLDTRIQVAEHSREKVMELVQLCDLSGTHFTQLQGMAAHLTEMTNLVAGENLSTSALQRIHRSTGNSSNISVPVEGGTLLGRMREVEQQSRFIGNEIRSMDGRMVELKQIVSTLGKSFTAIPAAASASSSSSSSSSNTETTSIAGHGPGYHQPRQHPTQQQQEQSHPIGPATRYYDDHYSPAASTNNNNNNNNNNNCNDTEAATVAQVIRDATTVMRSVLNAEAGETPSNKSGNTATGGRSGTPTQLTPLHYGSSNSTAQHSPPSVPTMSSMPLQVPAAAAATAAATAGTITTSSSSSSSSSSSRPSHGVSWYDQLNVHQQPDQPPSTQASSLPEQQPIMVPPSSSSSSSSGGAGAGDTSRLSVDFETALEQIFSSIDELNIPVTTTSTTTTAAAAATAAASDANPASSSSSSSSLSAGTAAVLSTPTAAATAGTGSVSRGRGSATTTTAVRTTPSADASVATTRITSLARVDERLDELRSEKERLRRLLMERMEQL